jgi:hypothetical protein
VTGYEPNTTTTTTFLTLFIWTSHAVLSLIILRNSRGIKTNLSITKIEIKTKSTRFKNPSETPHRQSVCVIRSVISGTSWFPTIHFFVFAAKNPQYQGCSGPLRTIANSIT